MFEEMKPERIITYPNPKEGTTGLAIQIIRVGGSLQGIYIGRFWKDEMDEWVYIDEDEIPKLIEELEKIENEYNMTEKFEPLRGVFVKGKEDYWWDFERDRELTYDEVRLLMKVKSAVQGLLEEIQKEKERVEEEERKAVKGGLFQERFLCQGWGACLDWFEQEIKKWFADVIEE
ncbi:MAG: hypothetical protein DRJ31_03140 [Candidatus Methanomethylicota archaeon]|uniref:Uncharacterized protein n=1 Tax=Thermoproteota archaeon TaxID=2056631 RepID=A0A497ES07_9CREN|nr:MAG: hypothetical protein DRJ31_03140 [Candidatus Verstraetearchaeota archaeon]